MEIQFTFSSTMAWIISASPSLPFSMGLHSSSGLAIEIVLDGTLRPTRDEDDPGCDSILDEGREFLWYSVICRKEAHTEAYTPPRASAVSNVASSTSSHSARCKQRAACIVSPCMRHNPITAGLEEEWFSTMPSSSIAAIAISTVLW